ncbi:MAG: nitroreductase/quinone reductase family protein [Acidimicrobiales bacterium]
MRVEHEGEYALVASKGGAPAHPGWYHNLIANPTILMQDGPEPFETDVRIVSGGERAAWWERAVAVFPTYEDYQAKTDREIPFSSPERFNGPGGQTAERGPTLLGQAGRRQPSSSSDCRPRRR